MTDGCLNKWYDGWTDGESLLLVFTNEWSCVSCSWEAETTKHELLHSSIVYKCYSDQVEQTFIMRFALHHHHHHNHEHHHHHYHHHHHNRDHHHHHRPIIINVAQLNSSVSILIAKVKVGNCQLLSDIWWFCNDCSTAFVEITSNNWTPKC